MHFGKPSPLSINLYIIRYSLIFVVAFIGCIYLFFYNHIISFLLFLITFISYLLAVFVYEKYRYVYTSYYTYNSYIKIKKGVIFKKYICIFKNSVQCTELKQGLLQKIYGVYTIKFYMTGKKYFLTDLNISDSNFLVSICKKDSRHET